MKHILKKKRGPVQLLHVTRAASLKLILQEGIHASTHGLFSVKGSAGAGIYAVHNDTDALYSLIRRCFSEDNFDDLFVILFSYNGEFYECMRVVLSHDEMEKLDESGICDVVSRAGHIIIPGKDAHVPSEQILGFYGVRAIVTKKI